MRVLRKRIITSTQNSLINQMLDKYYRIDFGKDINMRNVVVILLSALFFSCEDPAGISVELPNNGALSTVYTDTLTIERSTIKVDSSITSNTTFAVFGSYTDPAFGKVSAETYTNVTLSPQTTTDFYDFNLGTTAVYDSLKLFLYPISFSYGSDTLKKVNLRIHKTTQLLEAKRYNSFDAAPTYESVPYLSRSINIKDLRTKAGGDSAIIFKLDDDLGKKLFALNGKISIKKTVNGTETTYGDNTKVADVIKGLAFKIDAGSDVMYSISLASSSFVLYYHTLSSGGEIEKNSSGSAVKTYPFGMGTTYFTKFTPNYAGTALASINTTELLSSKANGTSFIQNGLGLVTKLKIPFFKQNASKIAINKAVLEITPRKSDYSLPTGLGLVELDDNNKVVRVSNVEQFVYLDNSNQAATIDTSKKYTLNITRYLQDNIAKNAKKNYALVPYNYFVNSSGTASFFRNTDTRRIILDPGSVKMKVYYTTGK